MKRRAMKVDRFHECAREAEGVSDGDVNTLVKFLRKSFGTLTLSWADARRVLRSSDLKQKALHEDLVDCVFGRGAHR